MYRAIYCGLAVSLLCASPSGAFAADDAPRVIDSAAAIDKISELTPSARPTSARLREMTQATVGVALERETKTSRFVGRIYRAFGAQHQPSYERDLSGAGVIVDKEHGLIATSAHLLRDEGRIIVTIYDDVFYDKSPTEVTGEIAAIDDESFVAVIAVPPDAVSLTHKPVWGHAQSLDLDDVVAMIASTPPNNKGCAVGVVLADDTEVTAKDKFRRSLTTERHLFAVSNSNIGNFLAGPGGPVFALNGPLVGIVTLNFGITYAVPFERVAPLVERAIADREINFPGMP